MAVGIATATPMANEVSHAEARLGVNPSRATVWTSDITSDMAMAMIAGTSRGTYLGPDAVVAAWLARERHSS
jgi:hypothetical protein